VEPAGCLLSFFGMTQHYAPLIDDYAARTSSMCVCMKCYFPASTELLMTGYAGKANTPHSKNLQKQNSLVMLHYASYLSYLSHISVEQESN
jgi:hypothetical protein